MKNIQKRRINIAGALHFQPLFKQPYDNRVPFHINFIIYGTCNSDFSYKLNFSYVHNYIRASKRVWFSNDTLLKLI